MAKQNSNRVKLVVIEHDMVGDFEINHAERLLKMPNNGGWQLPEDSEFELDLHNGIKHKSSK